MSTIKLTSNSDNAVTIIPNIFIDQYMPSANGEFVKVYLLLMEALTSNMPISICGIADKLNHTEKDVVRALKYWEQAGLLKLTINSSRELTSICIISSKEDASGSNAISNEQSITDSDVELPTTVSSVEDNYKETYDDTDIDETVKSIFIPASSNDSNTIPEKVTYSKNELSNFIEQDDISELIFVAQKYIGKTLGSSDTNTLLYIYDKLGFTVELMEYLIEYCVNIGHKNMRYIEKVAISWAKEDIITVEQAKNITNLYSKKCYPVLKAFGLNGRNPGESEKAFIVKWTNSYGFSMDIILNACDRTIQTIHQPSFEYADSILSNWNKQGVKRLDDIKRLDEQFATTKKQKQVANNSTQAATPNKIISKNSFTDFNQRTYDYDALEKRILANR